VHKHQRDVCVKNFFTVQMSHPALGEGKPQRRETPIGQNGQLVAPGFVLYQVFSRPFVFQINSQGYVDSALLWCNTSLYEQGSTTTGVLKAVIDAHRPRDDQQCQQPITARLVCITAIISTVVANVVIASSVGSGQHFMNHIPSLLWRACGSDIYTESYLNCLYRVKILPIT